MKKFSLPLFILISLLPSFVFAQVNLSTSLFTYWPFDGALEADDIAGIVNWNGTVDGATQITGVVGNAYEFDGTDDEIEFSDASSAFSCPSASVCLDKHLTINIWVRDDDITSEEGRWIFKDGSFALYADDDDLILTLTGITNSPFGVPDIVISDSQFHMYTITRSDTTGDVKFYVDGVQAGSTLVGGTEDLTITTNSLFMGSSNGTNFFLGALDEVRFWNRVLSDADVLFLFNQTTVAEEISDGIGNGLSNFFTSIGLNVIQGSFISMISIFLAVYVPTRSFFTSSVVGGLVLVSFLTLGLFGTWIALLIAVPITLFVMMVLRKMLIPKDA